MKEEFFYFIRELFNTLNLDLVPKNKLEEQALTSLKNVRTLFNKYFYSVTIGEFEEIKEELETIQEKIKLFEGLNDKSKMN